MSSSDSCSPLNYVYEKKKTIRARIFPFPNTSKRFRIWLLRNNLKYKDHQHFQQGPVDRNAKSQLIDHKLNLSRLKAFKIKTPIEKLIRTLNYKSTTKRISAPVYLMKNMDLLPLPFQQFIDMHFVVIGTKCYHYRSKVRPTQRSTSTQTKRECYKRIAKEGYWSDLGSKHGK